MTLGKILFFGGMIGIVAAIALLVISITLLKSRKSSLQKRLEEEY